MSLISGNYEFVLDTPTYYAGHSGCTYADLFEYEILPKFQEWCSDCTYTTVTSSNCPAIKLPWSDGTVGSDNFATFYINATASSSVSSSSKNFYYGVGGSNAIPSTLNVSRNTESSGGGGGASTWSPTTGKIKIRAFAETGAIHLGAYPSNDNIKTNTFAHVTKIKSGDTYENCIIGGGGTGTSGSLGNGQKYIIQHETGTYDSVYPNVLNRTRAGAIQAVPIDIGDYKHDDWYVYFNANTAMQGVWNTDGDLLKDTTYGDKVWYPNAFTIDGQAFDAFILGTTNSASSYGIDICRKHVEG